jgi:hypothetical protein
MDARIYTLIYHIGKYHTTVNKHVSEDKNQLS